MSDKSAKIIYTKTDEAPMLATHSLLPIVKSFAAKAEVHFDIKDISLAARILSAFPDYLEEHQRIKNDLDDLGSLVQDAEANIIKLPNISASTPQLVATIQELQEKGFAIPSYPDFPKTNQEKAIQDKYNKIKGSAVNPVLREGNSDRRAPKSVKNYVKFNPHSMGEWNSTSKTHVATMQRGDFLHNEKSVCIEHAQDLRIEFHDTQGNILVIKENIAVMMNEIIDSSFMSKKELLCFLRKEIKEAKDSGILLSLHMKATMMKVSDPIIFGHAVSVYFSDLISKYQIVFDNLGVDFRNGFGDLLDKIIHLPDDQKSDIEDDINEILLKNADLAMVDSDKGITNLHVPSDIIIDASMPAMIRNSGKMWNKDNRTVDTKAIIPDSSYSRLYSTVINFCKKNGAFNPSTMGTVPNVGLMAQKAEEYGSHDKTFEIKSNGIVRVVDEENNILLEHSVEEGDIWRMCQTKDKPIRNWVKLAVDRANATKWPTVFWLDSDRAHDAEIIKKVNKYLLLHDTRNLDIQILSQEEATLFTLRRLIKGQNTISVTGNVLRDYLTDLFPILELGTSAKMLSIVPLMNGGGLFETGAGGSAPKHVQQFISEGHLRWDSLGEFMAIVASLEHFSLFHDNRKAKILANTLDIAIENLLREGKSPQRKVGQIDNRESHFYLAMYWAEELAKQNHNQELKDIFCVIFNNLQSNEIVIMQELNNVQGRTEDIQGYYFPQTEAVSSAMRPSKTLNDIIDNL